VPPADSRALAYLEDGHARLVSRNGNTFKTFAELTAAIGPAIRCRNAVLDGEIVHLDRDGKPQFWFGAVVFQHPASTLTRLSLRYANQRRRERGRQGRETRYSDVLC
jgi:hypothetical protein